VGVFTDFHGKYLSIDWLYEKLLYLEIKQYEIEKDAATLPFTM
jgi:hypothetical protein